MLLAIVLGCSPCTGLVADPAGAAPEGAVEHLEAVYAAWIADVGAERVCVDRVVIAEEYGSGAIQRDAGAYTVGFGPRAAQWGGSLRRGLCQALDLEEGLSAELEAVDPELGFLSVCADGPPAIGWPEVHAAACGEATVSASDRFLVDRVYVNAEPAPYVPLSMLPGSAVIAQVAEPLNVVAGDGVIGVLSYAEGNERVSVVDPETGATEVVLAAPEGEYGWTNLVGGSDLALVHLATWTTADAARAYDVTPIGGPTWPLTTDVYLEAMAVSEGVLYAAPWQASGSQLATLRLDTGEQGALPLPAPTEGEAIWVRRMVSAPGGVVAELEDVSLLDLEGSLGVHVYRTFLARSDGVVWTELPVSGSPLGVTSDGRLLATFTPEPNTAYGTYALTTGDLALSESVCPETTGIPTVVVGETAYAVGRDAWLMLTPYALE